MQCLTPLKGDASSRTKSAVAAGTIDIRENPTQDISALSRDTENALNELGRIFDKKKIEEQQELAAVFGEEAFRLAHNMKDDGSGRKIAVHAIIGGIMSQITGAGFASGAVGAGLNEALIKSLKGLDPGTAQIVSAIVGAAAAKASGGNAAAGASAAAAGTKWNYFLMSRPDEFGIRELAKNILRKKDGQELSEEETNQLIREVNNILSLLEPDLGHDEKNPYAEDINNYKYAIGYLSRHGVTTDSAKRFFTAYNETVRNKDWTGVYEQPGVIIVHGDRKTYTMIDIPLRPPIPVYNPFDTRPYQEGQIIGGGYSSKSQKMEDDNNPLGKGTHPEGQAIGGRGSSGGQKAEGNNNPLETGTSQNHSVGSPTKDSSKENTTFSTEHEAKGSPGTTTSPSQENKGDKSNPQSKVEFGKTVVIETFKAEADHPVTLYNKVSNNAVKALRVGIFAPLGLGYDMYQDYRKYSGIDLAKVEFINGTAFVFSSAADSLLIGSLGMSVEATIPANIVIVEMANRFKKNGAKSDEEKRRENQ